LVALLVKLEMVYAILKSVNVSNVFWGVGCLLDFFFCVLFLSYCCAHLFLREKNFWWLRWRQILMENMRFAAWVLYII